MLVLNERAATFGASSARLVRNKILQSLSVGEFDRLRPHLQPVKFKPREVVHRENASARGIYFIEEGLIARTVQTRHDAPFEIAMEGRSGVVGLSLALGGSLAIHQTAVVIAGSALRIEKQAFEKLARELPELQAALMRQTHSLGLQISYLGLCNGSHMIEQRLPRWLLLACEQVGADDLPVTQEAIATLLGVRRPGITEALQKLHQDGLIVKTRGNIRLRNRSGLAARSCSCHQLIQDSRDRLQGPMHAHILPQNAE